MNENQIKPGKLSIIMPVYNTGHLFAESYNSILNQDYSDFELLVVDDGSTNNTYQVIEEYTVKDKRIKLLQNESNQGVAFSRNRALSEVTGEYIAFLDCGDIWLMNKIKAQLTALKATDSDVAYTGYQYFDEDPARIKRKYQVPEKISYRDLLKENYLGCSTVLLKRDKQENLKFSLDYFHEDYVLWLQLIKQQKKFIGLPEVYVSYRIGGRSANKLKAAKNRWKIYRVSEGFSILKSLFYFSIYSLKMIKKYF